MNKKSNAPFTWDEIENQVRSAILAQASIIGQFGPDDPIFACSYLGIEGDEWNKDYMSREDIASIPLERHNLFHQVKRAYLYAYQLDGFEDATPEDWHEMAGILEGFPQTDYVGEPSPLCPRNDFPLRRVLETFFARWSWYEEDYELTVRQLSLLADMTIPATRTSLSKEGFKLQQIRGTGSRNDDASSARLDPRDTLTWLSRRRGFIPNREPRSPSATSVKLPALLVDTSVTFSTLLSMATQLECATPQDIRQAVGRSDNWTEKFLAGRSVEIDVEALRVIAKLLELEEPEFVSRAVKHLIELEVGF